MKTLIITTTCQATVKETWTAEVPDDWAPPADFDAAYDDVLSSDLDFQVEDEVSNESDRQFEGYEVTS